MAVGDRAIGLQETDCHRQHIEQRGGDLGGVKHQRASVAVRRGLGDRGDQRGAKLVGVLVVKTGVIMARQSE